MVAIIDDREDVWNFSPNLIHVKPYQFFSGTADINAPPGLTASSPDSQPADINRRKSRVVRVPKRKLSSSQEVKQPEEPKETGSKDKQSEDRVNSEETKPSTDQAKPSTESTKSEEKTEKPEEKSTPNDTGQPTGDAVPNNKSSDEQQEDEGTKDDDLDVSSSDDEEQGDDTNSKEQTVPARGMGGSDTENSDKTTPPKEETEDPCLKEGEKTQQCNETSDTAVETTDKPDAPVGDSEKPNAEEPNTDSSVDHVAGESKPPSDSVEGLGEGDTQTMTDPERDDVEYEEMVEWEDSDDYLLYLEEVLTRIHTAFYECYDQTKNRDSNEELPSLKKIIPYVHKKVLQGTNIVFSGVFPTNMPAEKSRAHIVARSLGANIQTVFVGPDGSSEGESATTHVVAARPGTQKVRQARKYKKVHVVTAEWLWTCADRWERVDERIYLLKEDLSGPPRDSPDPRPETRPGKRKSEDNLSEFDPVSGQRTQKQSKVARVDGPGAMREEGDETEPQPSTSEGLRPHPVLERRFSESYNPMLAFSRADIDDMDKEVEDILDASDSDDDDDDDDDENEEKQTKKQEKTLRRKVLNSTPDTSSEESLSADFPKGWRKKCYKKSPLSEQSQVKGDPEEDEERLEEERADQPHRIMRHSSDSDSEVESDKESFDESIGSVDEEMAAAVEKELLNF